MRVKPFGYVLSGHDHLARNRASECADHRRVPRHRPRYRHPSLITRLDTYPGRTCSGPARAGPFRTRHRRRRRAHRRSRPDRRRRHRIAPPHVRIDERTDPGRRGRSAGPVENHSETAPGQTDRAHFRSPFLLAGQAMLLLPAGAAASGTGSARVIALTSKEGAADPEAGLAPTAPTGPHCCPWSAPSLPNKERSDRIGDLTGLHRQRDECLDKGFHPDGRDDQGRGHRPPAST